MVSVLHVRALNKHWGLSSAHPISCETLWCQNCTCWHQWSFWCQYWTSHHLWNIVVSEMCMLSSVIILVSVLDIPSLFKHCSVRSACYHLWTIFLSVLNMQSFVKHCAVISASLMKHCSLSILCYWEFMHMSLTYLGTMDDCYDDGLSLHCLKI